MLKPNPGSVAAIIAEQGINAIRGMPIICDGGPPQYISDKLIDKILSERAADGDPLGQTAWKERLYGGDSPTSDLVAHIYPQVSYPRVDALQQALAMEKAADALHGAEMEHVRVHLMDGARMIRQLFEQANAPTQLSLVVLDEGGVMEAYHSTPGTTTVELLDCQNGDAGQINSVTKDYLPLLMKAFGPLADWPAHVRIASDDDVDVVATIANAAGDTMGVRGIYSEQGLQLTLGEMHRDEGYNSSYRFLQSVSFDDGRPSLQVGDEPFDIWSHTVNRPGYAAVNQLTLDKPLDQTLSERPPAARDRQTN